MKMNDSISLETFTHLVNLAALQLTQAEGEYLRQQLNNQLKVIQELAAIPLDEDVQVTSHGVPYTAASSPAPREDTWIPYPNAQEILAQAPQAEDGYIIVPEIQHTDLD
jgi:aspartyl-tRNA(Asn)/glutamyl-tRNA(Gln) amidotransferase subunit C